MPVDLKYLRLALDAHDSDLLLVGDEFADGGRYVQWEVPRRESVSWSWPDWEDAYGRLTEDWRRRFELREG